MKKPILIQVVSIFLSIFMLTACGTTKYETEGTTYKNEIAVAEGNSKVVNLLQDAVADYVNDMKSVTVSGNDYCFNDEAGANVFVRNYWNPGTNVSAARIVRLNWKATSSPYQVFVSTNEDFDGADTYQTSVNSLALPNLYMATTYYWKVVDANNKTLSVNSFKTEDSVRVLYTGSVNNVRDLGGRMTSSGKRVKQGIIYRGAEMNLQTYTDENGATHYLNLKSGELDILKYQLKINTEIDFRTDAETLALTRSPLGDEVKYMHDSIGAYTGMFCKHSNGQDNPTMRATYQEIFRELMTASADNVIYFHCWGGADRTGTIGFLLNGLLGVSYTDLLIDYELTTFSNNYREKEVDDPNNYNYFRSMVTQLERDYKYNEGETISEIIENYMKDCLFLSTEEIAALKTNLLED